MNWNKIDYKIFNNNRSFKSKLYSYWVIWICPLHVFSTKHFYCTSIIWVNIFVIYLFSEMIGHWYTLSALKSVENLLVLYYDLVKIYIALHFFCNQSVLYYYLLIIYLFFSLIGKFTSFSAVWLVQNLPEHGNMSPSLVILSMNLTN